MSQPKAMHAYRQTQKVGGDARGTEANALYAAALRLRDTAAGSDDLAFSEALIANLRLWNTLISDMMRPENPLPAEIKGNLYKLFLFVDKQTVARLAEPTSREIGSLVSINLEIARGLHTKPVEEDLASTAPVEQQRVAIQG